jgi:predicted MFS family arabinose efflux permease
MRVRSVGLAGAAGLALADASIVTLALAELLTELDTTIEGVAAVIGVYTLVLCLTLLGAWRVAQTYGYRAVGVAGFALFAAASLVCAGADDVTTLLIGRALQAVGGAGGLVAAFALLHADAVPQRNLWVGAAVLSSAVGPALGGALTQAFDWRAIFIVQVPLALIGAAACLASPATAREQETPRPPPDAGPALALALVSAALTGVLFLLILLLVAGWNVTPLAAAGAVTALPAGALIGSRVSRGDAVSRSAAGCLLVGAGVLALAWLPGANPLWTVPPQLLAGLGMGLSLPALGGELLPERSARDAAVLLTIRHAGIALALLLIAPIAANRLDSTVEQARLQGVAIVLDAPLAPQDKISLAPDLLASVEAREPRNALRAAVADNRDRFSGDDADAYASLGQRADDVLVTAVARAFKPAFLITGGLALLGAAALVFLLGARFRLAALASAVALALLAPAAYGLTRSVASPEPVVIADPCSGRDLPDSGGLTGFLQDQALEQLDRLACENGLLPGGARAGHRRRLRGTGLRAEVRSESALAGGHPGRPTGLGLRTRPSSEHYG